MIHQYTVALPISGGIGVEHVVDMDDLLNIPAAEPFARNLHIQSFFASGPAVGFEFSFKDEAYYDPDPVWFQVAADPGYISVHPVKSTRLYFRSASNFTLNVLVLLRYTVIERD